jgi:hypothetical protein
MESTEKQITRQRECGNLPFILGINSLTVSQLDAELAAGGRVVFYEYCISFVFFTLRHPSPIYFLRAQQWSWPRGLPYSLVTLLLGWWGLPWGMIYTPLTLLTNLAGGRDITAEVRAKVLQASAGERGA